MNKEAERELGYLAVNLVAAMTPSSLNHYYHPFPEPR